jgi:hypothetical protein
VYGFYTIKSDSFRLDTANLFPHNHKITSAGKSVTVEHRHNVSTGSHSHTIAGVTNKRSNHKGERVRPTRNNPREHNGPYLLKFSAATIVVKPPKNTSIVYTFPNDYLTYSGGIIDASPAVLAKNYVAKKFEGRPPYYALAFIIKL